MRRPWRSRWRPGTQRPALNRRYLELETVKKILAEVLGARLSNEDEMIRRRLEKRRPWPATFGLGE